MHNTKAVAIRGIFAMVLSVFAWGAQAEQRTFDVSPGSHFELDADWGHIDIQTSDRAAIEVAVERAEKVALKFDQGSGKLSVRSRTQDKGAFGWFKNMGPAPVFRVTVPDQTSLDLTTAGGNIHVEDIEGTVAVKTSGGKVVLGEVAGDVEGRTAGGSIEIAAASGSVLANTSGGSIRIGNAAASVEAKTTGGSIRIGQAVGPVHVRTTGGSLELGRVNSSINARTTGGSIHAAFDGQPDADSDLRTTGGSINLALAEGVAVDLDARSTGGRVSIGVPLTSQESEGKSKLEASVNGGGPKVTLRTTGGSIRLRGMP